MSGTNLPKLFGIDFEVFGRVQGVFFRKYTQKEALKLGIKGWCRNTYQESVEGQLEGEEKGFKKMKYWLQETGSPSSRIDKVLFKNERNIDKYTHTGFEIRH